MNETTGSHFVIVCSTALLLCLGLNAVNPLSAFSENQTPLEAVMYSIPLEHKGVNLNRAHFDPTGKKLAYQIEKNGKKLFVIEGKEGAPHDNVDTFIFSPGGNKYIYRASDAGKNVFIYNDGKSQTTFDGTRAGESVFSVRRQSLLHT